MTLVTLRPNVTVSSSGAILVGGATAHAILSDNVDTSYICSDSSMALQDLVIGFDSVAIPANAYIKSITPRVRWRANAHALMLGVKSALPASPLYNRTETVWAAPTILTTQTGGVVTPIFNNAQTEIDNLQVKLWYSYNNEFLLQIAELYLDVVYNTVPVISAVTVSGYLAVARPTVGWSYMDAEQDPQVGYQAKVFTAAQYSAGGFDPATAVAAWSSGNAVSNALSAIPSIDLVNGTTYKAYVRGTDIDVNGPAKAYSAWAVSSVFTITITLPTAPVVPTLTLSTSTARIDVTVTGPANGDPVCETYSLERSYDNSISWVAVSLATSKPLVPGQVIVFADYAVRPNIAVIYRVRTTGTRAGTVFTSVWSIVSSQATLPVTDFWLKNPGNPTQNIRLRLAGDLDSESEELQGLFKPLGRDRAVVIAGDIYGESFDLPLAFYNEADWLAFEILRKAKTTLLFQSDMTQQWWVRLGASRKARLVNRVERRITPYRQIQISAVEVDGV